MIIKILIALITTWASIATAEVTLVGNVPREIPHLQENLDRVWAYEVKTYSKGAAALPPPEIGFYVFQHEDTEWQAWQRDWGQTNPNLWTDWTQLSGQPFLAFHYSLSNRIQINPTLTYLRYYNRDTYQETTGFGFYVTSHEMLHYVLENNGIPGHLHHCLFITEKNGHSLMGNMAQYLIDQNISAPIIQKIGLETEKGMTPCDQLNDAERTQVAQIISELPL